MKTLDITKFNTAEMDLMFAATTGDAYAIERPVRLKVAIEILTFAGVELSETFLTILREELGADRDFGHGADCEGATLDREDAIVGDYR